jgi:hypothetical protein
MIWQLSRKPLRVSSLLTPHFFLKAIDLISASDTTETYKGELWGLRK